MALPRSVHDNALPTVQLETRLALDQWHLFRVRGSGH